MYKVSGLEFDGQKIISAELVDADGQCHLTEDAIVMQWTGLLDKNGREIYESDIVHSDWWHCNLEVRWCDGKNEFLRCQVGWILDDEKLGPVCHIEELTAHCELLEPPGREDYFNGVVIGNIYENSDLLKKAS